MAILKLTHSQYWKMRNDPIAYSVDARFIDKTNEYEIECDNNTAKKIKELVDS